MPKLVQSENLDFTSRNQILNTNLARKSSNSDASTAISDLTTEESTTTSNPLVPLLKGRISSNSQGNIFNFEKRSRSPRSASFNSPRSSKSSFNSPRVTHSDWRGVKSHTYEEYSSEIFQLTDEDATIADSELYNSETEDDCDLNFIENYCKNEIANSYANYKHISHKEDTGLKKCTNPLFNDFKANEYITLHKKVWEVPTDHGQVTLNPIFNNQQLTQVLKDSRKEWPKSLPMVSKRVYKHLSLIKRRSLPEMNFQILKETNLSTQSSLSSQASPATTTTTTTAASPSTFTNSYSGIVQKENGKVLNPIYRKFVPNTTIYIPTPTPSSTTTTSLASSMPKASFNTEAIIYHQKNKRKNSFNLPETAVVNL